MDNRLNMNRIMVKPACELSVDGLPQASCCTNNIFCTNEKELLA